MRFLLDHPVVFLLVMLIVLGCTTRLGAALHARRGPSDDDKRGEFDLVLGATLTLLSLIVGFSYSMAANRYDQRKNLEEAEANAIGTAYARAGLVPEADTAKLRQLLRDYTSMRVQFYTTRDPVQRRELYQNTARQQAQLWAAMVASAKAAPSMLTAQAVVSMNDAINSQSYSQAAAWNRIPTGAWALLCTIAIVATLMIGYRFHPRHQKRKLMLILPSLIAVSMFLIADIDCPLGGVIRVIPQNLIALEAALG
jgi:hypothetical protein